MKSPLNTPRHITSQILLAVLVPVVILTCIITAYYAYSRYQEIEHTQVQMGKVTTSYLAQAAELGCLRRRFARTARPGRCHPESRSRQ